MKLTVALFAVFGSIAVAAMQTNSAAGGLALQTLSTDASLVTGGDVLVEVTVPESMPPDSVRITAAGRNITGSFKRTKAGAAKLIGLVTGLPNGRSTIVAESRDGRASLDVMNYPITGPVFSGPWVQPFICQTDAFTLPDGSKLGAPLDANCSANTVVQYIYRSTNPSDEPRQAFKPLPTPTALPADVAKTTTSSGETVNFIVRVETGTMNRGIYQNAILHDPTTDPPVSPATPPRGWNGRLIAMHGTGCPGGWYIQGSALGANILDVERLGKGYALFNNTLNHPTNSCNAVVAAETAMMGKEHFIETFGVPFYTMSTGASGGAYTSLQIADAYPGLFDGVEIRATFPDALSIALSGLDGRLLMHYFMVTNPTALSDEQKVAVSGYAGMKAFLDAANQSQRTDPVPNRPDMEGYQSARWNAAVPASLRYHPQTNPRGARPTVFDVARNIYGVDPATGFALRPFDNVGVQYGLAALNAGVITPAQFLDLNEKIGGYDHDANYTAARTSGNADAIKRAYQSGLMLGGNGGLSSIPIFDNATSNEASGYHYGWFHFALRERIRQGNGGRSDNLVMWRSTTPGTGEALFEKWMTAYKSDASPESQRAKVLRAKPADATDGCYDKSTPPQFIHEDLAFSSKPVSKCSALYPVYSNPRREAGGPLAANILKCQLKPVDPRDYHVTFDAAQLARLKAVFPGGVCDWSKPGVNQVPVVTWASFGPSPKNLVFELNAQGR